MYGERHIIPFCCYLLSRLLKLQVAATNPDFEVTGKQITITHIENTIGIF